jgi:hypothetical protein
MKWNLAKICLTNIFYLFLGGFENFGATKKCFQSNSEGEVLGTNSKNFDTSPILEP